MKTKAITISIPVTKELKEALKSKVDRTDRKAVNHEYYGSYFLVNQATDHSKILNSLYKIIYEQIKNV